MYIVYFIIAVVVGLGVYLYCRFSTKRAVSELNKIVERLANGDLSEKIEISKQNHTHASLARNINKILANLERATQFSEDIRKGNFQVSYQPVSPNDKFGHSLSGMLERLQEVSEQDRVRRWSTEGISHFSDIFQSSNSNLQELSKSIIVELVKYMEVNQGGFFIFNDEDPEEPLLELMACYAYSRNKYSKKTIPVGDGLIGQAFLEKATIHMTEVPQYYTEITSGLGEATPSSILIVPLKVNEQVEGIIEIASFNSFEPYQVDFVEKLAESIAATIAAVKTNDKTRKLLKKSQEQTERMRVQEEEMRQQNEELESSQKELERQTTQLEKILTESREQEASLTSLINNTSDLIATIDTEFNIQLFNNAFSEFYSDDETKVAQGLHIISLYPEAYKIAFQNDFEKALRKEYFQVQRKMISKGKLSIFDIYYSPITAEDGTVTGIAIFSKDVTEYIKKNEEIRRSQQEVAQQAQQLQHNKEAVNRSGVATVEFDMDGYVLDANDAFLKILKYDSIDEVLGESHELFMPPQQLNSKAYKNFWNRLRNGESSSAQYERIAKDGSTVWLAGSYNVVSEVNGRAIMVIQVGFDVTETVDLIYKTMHQAQQIQMAQNEAKQQVDKLNLEKAKQEAVVDSLSEGVLRFDVKGNIEYCNRKAEKLLHIEKAKVIGQSVQTILPITLETISATEIRIFYEENGKEVDVADVIQLASKQNGSEELNVSFQENEIGSSLNVTAFLSSKTN